ncbi:hypothetical protein [Litoreibacter albidus]|uniref:DUF1127 domain-containing protein n=1 Tax=Litoreibacter albidus TaxID=670155 RepID=A0A1H2XS03_9RHOB|nr:hypothetical protein [Litoreibacter albidus]SDW95498.1 hypothetical protein SAMN04488001_2087 [Litoreibacter albidus]
MAYITHAQPTSLFARIGDFFMAMFNSIDLAASANARIAQMEKLNAKSDEELSAMGMRREDIARYVFRDIYHI